MKVIPSGKIGQLSCLVSTFLSRAASRKQRLFTPEAAKACCLDKLPLTEVEPDQSASLCFQCNHLQSLTWDLAQPVQKKLREFAANS